MTDTTKTGGPAFPHKNPNYDGNWDKEPQRGGMTLRDWFAGQALAGMMANCGDSWVNGWTDCIENAAAVAYRCADAMIAARGDA